MIQNTHRDGERLSTVTGPKNISFFAYLKMSNIFTGPTHFLPVMVWGQVSFEQTGYFITSFLLQAHLIMIFIQVKK